MSNPYLPQLPHIDMPQFEVPDMPTQHMFSDTQFEIIRKYILDFQKTLDDEHEVGALLTNFGQARLMFVESVTYEKSVLMVFKGTVDGNSATLIQHINQINFMLMSVQKCDPEKPARRIGFNAD